MNRLWVTAFYSQNATCRVSIPLGTDSLCSRSHRLGRGGVSLVICEEGQHREGFKHPLRRPSDATVAVVRGETDTRAPP